MMNNEARYGQTLDVKRSSNQAFESWLSRAWPRQLLQALQTRVFRNIVLVV